MDLFWRVRVEAFVEGSDRMLQGASTSGMFLRMARKRQDF